MKHKIIALAAAASILLGTSPFTLPVSAAPETVTVYEAESDELLQRTYTLMQQFTADHPGTLLENILPDWYGVAIRYPAEQESSILSDLAAVLQENSIPEEMVAYAPLPLSTDIRMGDVDQNGKVEIADAILLARWLAEDKEITVTAEGLAAADLTGDSLVTADDQAKLLCRLAGVKEDPQPSEKRSVDLLAGIQPGDAEKGDPTALEFRQAQGKFSVDLLKQTAADEEDKTKNLLISPVSVSLALGMTMNGAKGQTLEEMQKVLGNDLTAAQLNAYYAGWSGKLLEPTVFETCEVVGDQLVRGSEEHYPVTLANAVWINDNTNLIQVPQSFLQTVADFYKAGFYRAPFDQTTVDEVNAWCDENTHHMIPKVIDRLSERDCMLLANALTFEEEWETGYEPDKVGTGKFCPAGGEAHDAEMLYGTETRYLDDGRATGFIKDYSGGRFAFAAILPNEGITLDEYIEGLEEQSLRSILVNYVNADVRTTMPKFSFDYDTEMKDTLTALGMPTAFINGAADFTGLNEAEGVDTWIDNVIHKTHIELCESGTKAAAVTVVIMRANGVSEPRETKTVVLDRPFLFMIYDRSNDLPLFIGAVRDVQAQ